MKRSLSLETNRYVYIYIYILIIVVEIVLTAKRLSEKNNIIEMLSVLSKGWSELVNPEN